MQVNENSQVGRNDLPQIHWTDLLLAHPEFVSQYILEISEDKWECRCGNTHESDGFEPCDEVGEQVPAELGPWDGALYVCTRCWRVINGNTLEILREVDEVVIEKNMEYRWPNL